MAADTYARILGAVGQALDLAEAKTFAVRDTEAGLSLDLTDGRGERHVYELSLADLVDLVNWTEANSAISAISAQVMDIDIMDRDEGMLSRLLERRELVGAR